MFNIHGLHDVASWMQSNQMQLITSSTEVLWSATARRQSQLPHTSRRGRLDVFNPVSRHRELTALCH